MFEIAGDPVRWLVTRDSLTSPETAVRTEELSFTAARDLFNKLEAARKEHGHKCWYRLHHFPKGKLSEYGVQKQIVPFWNPDDWYVH